MSRSNKRGRTPVRNKFPAVETPSNVQLQGQADHETSDTPPVSGSVPMLRSTPASNSAPAQTLPVNCKSCETLLQTNHAALARLLDEIARLRGDIQDCISNKPAYDSDLHCENAGNPEQIDELLWQIRQRDEKLTSLERERDSLVQQNQELASKLASQNVRKSVQTSNSTRMTPCHGKSEKS